MDRKADRKPYEKPAVALERNLEALAADCGTGINSLYLGDNNCKGEVDCQVPYS